MIKKIFISARGKNDIKIAFTENKKLSNLEIDNANQKFTKGNIYKGCVTKIESSLDAIFIDYGKEKDGFLPFKEISRRYLKYLGVKNGLKSIKDDSFIKGKDVIVQIDKEEKEEKGASLTTYLNLAGCYTVLMLNNNKSKGISKRIDGEERNVLKLNLKSMSFPYNMGVIVRTLGFGKKFDDLKWEINILLSQIKIIEILSSIQNSPSLIYEEHSIITKVMRDYLKKDLNKLIIDDIKIFNLFYKYLNIIKSDLILKICFYDSNISLFNKFKIENQMEITFKREIFLSSGGMITIDYTEALISIDINSSKFNKCKNIEETALQTNLEAVDEIIKQIRIRDLNGLIIIDFIDMNLTESKKAVEKNIKNALLADKAKIQIGKISKFGLLEISREKNKHSFINNNKIFCNKCNGIGKIDNIKILSFNILNSIEEELFKKNTYQIHIEAPIELANFLINFKKKQIYNLEKKTKIKIILIVNKFIKFPDYKIYRFKYNNRKYRLFKKKYQKIKKKKKINYYFLFLNKKIKNNKISLIENLLNFIKTNKYNDAWRRPTFA